MGLTFAGDEARCIPGIDRQRDGIGGDECEEPRMKCDVLIRKRVKTQGHPCQHGHPDNMCHSEQLKESFALIDQGLTEHSQAYGS